jgi:hypothetical protein
MLIMIPKPKHDIYIKSGDRYAKIAWLHEYKDFEVMIGFYGFTGTDPVLAHEYPDRIVSSEEMNNLKIVHTAKIVPTEMPKSHFTFHRDQEHRSGEFHLKYGKETKHAIRPKYKIDEDTGVFLDFFLFSDVIDRYTQSVTQPDETDLIFEINAHAAISLRVQYCGTNFDYQSDKKTEISKLGISHINLVGICDRKLQVYFQPQAILLNGEVLANKIPGTFFIIRFQTYDDNFLLKTFIFN